MKTNNGESKSIVFCFKLSDDAFSLLINVKMPTTVGILTFMSRINFIFKLSMENFYNLGARFFFMSQIMINVFLIAYAQKPSSNAHTDISSGAILGLS